MILKPQEGPQTNLLKCSADIAIYGGAAGGGKTFGMLLDSTRLSRYPGTSATFFRRTMPEILSAGGIWENSYDIYSVTGAKPNKARHTWTFPNGSKISFGNLQYEETVKAYQSSQIDILYFDEASHFCLTPDTDVLTEDGWKPITKIKKGEKVYSVNSKKEGEFKEVTDLHSYDFNGDLICANQRTGVSFRATPNHEFVVKKQDKRKSIKKKRLDMWGHDSILRVAKKSSGNETEWLNIAPPKGRGHGRNSNSARRVKTKSWLAFLGWYLSEGCSYKRKDRTGSPIVSIRQTKKDGQIKLEKVLDSLPWRYKKIKNEGQYYIYSRQVYDMVSYLGNTYTKRVPKWVFGLAPKLIKIFLESFVDGDGYRPTDGCITIGLANEGLVDDLQHLYSLCGRAATKKNTIRKLHGKEFFASVLTVSKPSRTITMVKNHCLYKEKYKGKVYCLTVEGNGNFLMRHNGRACFSGNSKKQFFYLLSRNRSRTGNIRPYVRAATNPDPDSWLREFIDWWIDDEGYAIPERSGVIRYLYHINDKYHWSSDKKELMDKHPELSKEVEPKTVTFIPSTLEDNKILMENDPQYKATLFSLTAVDKARLHGGNWNVREAAGEFFQREWFEVIEESEMLGGNRITIRFWDRAGTSAEEAKERKNLGTQAETASVKLSFYQGIFYVEDVTAKMLSPKQVANEIDSIVQMDGPSVIVGLSQDPGQAGKMESQSHAERHKDRIVWITRETGSKETRAKPVSAKAQRYKIKVVKAAWNNKFFSQLENFPDGKKDICDALSGAYSYFVEEGMIADYGVKNNEVDKRVAGGLSTLKKGRYQF